MLIFPCLPFCQRQNGRQGKKEKKAGVTPLETVNKLVVDILENKKVEVSKENAIRAKLTIGALTRQKATSPRFPETHNINYYGIEISLKDVRDMCRKYNF